MATAHIESNYEDIANVVIMPGDPKRARYIAENYLKNYKLINEIRGMTAYTGYYEGVKVTVFPSGMGIPSIGIYAYELFTNYDVDYIIRIGTVGAYDANLKLGDVILTNRVYSDSSYARVQDGYEDNYLDAFMEVNDIIKRVANLNKYKIVEGDILTSDVFYSKTDYRDIMKQYNVLGVEMETFGLFQTARICKKKAASILSVSNSFCTNEELTAQQRERHLHNMIEIALKTSLNLQK